MIDEHDGVVTKRAFRSANRRLDLFRSCCPDNSDAGVLHGRNLDWWTKSAILSRYTTTCNFVGGAAGEFTTIGWPGFIGAFSGIAPGRFAITLNAVLSLEPAVPATPVVLVLRSVLEEAQSFDEALSILSAASLPSDSLLLLHGYSSR